MRNLPQTIEIIRTPAGPAPEWVRQQWVGIRMLATPAAEGVLGMVAWIIAEDILGEDPPNDVELPLAFEVADTEAISKLHAKSPEAACWFPENFPPGPMIFDADEVVIVP